MKTLLHPVRLAIVQQLEIGSRRLTIAQLAAELPEIPQATLYRHVNALVDAAICVVVERRKVHSVEERVYAIRSPEATLAQPDERDMAHDAEQRFDAVAMFLASLGSDFDASKRSRRRDVGPGARFVSTVAHLTADDIVELVRIREWIVGLRRRPVPADAKPRMIAFMDFPYVRRLATTTDGEELPPPE